MHPEVFQNHTPKLKKCTPGLPRDPARDHTRKKITNYALEDAPREPKLDHKNHSKERLNAPLMHIWGAKAADVTVAALNTF